MSEPCETCKDSEGGEGQVLIYETPDLESFFGPCPSCRRVVSVEFIKAAEAMADRVAIDLWCKGDHTQLRLALEAFRSTQEKP